MHVSTEAHGNRAQTDNHNSLADAAPAVPEASATSPTLSMSGRISSVIAIATTASKNACGRSAAPSPSPSTAAPRGPT